MTLSLKQILPDEINWQQIVIFFLGKFKQFISPTAIITHHLIFHEQIAVAYAILCYFLTTCSRATAVSVIFRRIARASAPIFLTKETAFCIGNLRQILFIDCLLVSAGNFTNVLFNFISHGLFLLIKFNGL